MKRYGLTLILCAAALLAGCANQPTAQWYEQTQQKKLDAAMQWGLVADDAVEQTRLAVMAQPTLKGKPLYIANRRGTHFERAFRNYMITGLVNAGLPVTPSRDGAVEITYETQVVRHGDAFDPSLFGYRPGMAAAGAGSFWVLRGLAKSSSSTGLAAATIAGAAGYDVYRATEPTGVELLLTTSIVESDRYIMRNTDAYYIEKGDAYLFEPCKTRSPRGCMPKRVR